MWLQRAEFVGFMKLLRIPIAIYTLLAWVVSLHISKLSFFTFTTLEVKLVCFIVGEMTRSRTTCIVGGWCVPDGAGAPASAVPASALLRRLAPTPSPPRGPAGSAWRVRLGDSTPPRPT